MFHDGVAIFAALRKRTTCYGLINRNGDVVAEPVYTCLKYNDADKLFIADDSKFRSSVINLEGREVIPTHGHIIRLKPGLFRTLDPRKKITVVDSENRTIIPAIYRNLFPICDGLLAAENKKGRWGVVSYDGEEVLPFKYDDICIVYKEENLRLPATDNLLIPVTLDGEQFYINLAGERVLF